VIDVKPVWCDNCCVTMLMTTPETAECIKLDDFVEMATEELEQARKTAKDPSDCTGFYNTVRSLESLVTTYYKCAARLARRTTDLNKLCAIWTGVVRVSDLVLKDMKTLKNTRPECGTGQLYDLVLEYKNAAFERYQQNAEDIQWETTPTPAGLFPKVN
jgi:hypothetical protein